MWWSAVCPFGASACTCTVQVHHFMWVEHGRCEAARSAPGDATACIRGVRGWAHAGTLHTPQSATPPPAPLPARSPHPYLPLHLPCASPPSPTHPNPFTPPTHPPILNPLLPPPPQMRLQATGRGRLLIHSYGSITRYDLAPGEKRIIGESPPVARIRYGTAATATTTCTAGLTGRPGRQTRTNTGGEAQNAAAAASSGV